MSAPVLIDADTGEVIPVLSAAEARALTDRIRAGLGAMWELIAEAYRGRAWEVLGYGSWDDYCTDKFGSSRLRLPREDRQEVVASLRDAGLSTRAIAAATNEPRSTVADELARVRDRTPEREVAAPHDDGPDTVQGTDGKQYPVRRIVREKPTEEDVRAAQRSGLLPSKVAEMRQAEESDDLTTKAAERFDDEEPHYAEQIRLDKALHRALTDLVILDPRRCVEVASRDESNAEGLLSGARRLVAWGQAVLDAPENQRLRRVK